MFVLKKISCVIMSAVISCSFASVGCVKNCEASSNFDAVNSRPANEHKKKQASSKNRTSRNCKYKKIRRGGHPKNKFKTLRPGKHGKN